MTFSKSRLKWTAWRNNWLDWWQNQKLELLKNLSESSSTRILHLNWVFHVQDAQSVMNLWCLLSTSIRNVRRSWLSNFLQTMYYWENSLISNKNSCQGLLTKPSVFKWSLCLWQLPQQTSCDKLQVILNKKPHCSHSRSSKQMSQMSQKLKAFIWQG